MTYAEFQAIKERMAANKPAMYDRVVLIELAEWLIAKIIDATPHSETSMRELWGTEAAIAALLERTVPLSPKV